MPDRSQDWLKAQLSRQMAQVKAPDTLWPKIEAERRARKAMPRSGWMLWPAIATVMVLASGDLLWQSVSAASGRGVNGMTLRQDEGAWVRTKASQTVASSVSCRTCHVEPGLY